MVRYQRQVNRFLHAIKNNVLFSNRATAKHSSLLFIILIFITLFPFYHRFIGAPSPFHSSTIECLGIIIQIFLIIAIFNHIYNYKGCDSPITNHGYPDFYPGQIGELCDSYSGGEKRIIFIETSGFACLRPRQACAVESAATTNPDMTIYLYMSSKKPPGSPEIDQGEGLERHCRTMEHLEALPNVRIIEEDLPERYLIDTPMESLLRDGSFNQSRYTYQHMSDALRIALLHRYGGIYLDLDVVVLRSLRCLRNTAGHLTILDHFCIENDVLAFDKGHKLLKFFMRWMKLNYKANERSTIGPDGLAHVFRLFCNVPASKKISEEMEESFICHNEAPLTLMPPDAFHPIRYLEQSRFFDANFVKSDVDRLKEKSYSVHIYGSGHGAHVPKSSLFAFLAQRFCPNIYEESLYDF